MAGRCGWSIWWCDAKPTEIEYIKMLLSVYGVGGLGGGCWGSVVFARLRQDTCILRAGCWSVMNTPLPTRLCSFTGPHHFGAKPA